MTAKGKNRVLSRRAWWTWGGHFVRRKRTSQLKADGKELVWGKILKPEKSEDK